MFAFLGENPPAFCLCLWVSIAISSSTVSLTNYLYKIGSAGRNHSYLRRAADSTVQLVLYGQKEKDTRKKSKI